MLGALFLIRKTNFLVIAVFFILFILIANAAEERINESYNQSSENGSYNTTLELKENSINDALSLNNSNSSHEDNSNSSHEENQEGIKETSDESLTSNTNISNQITNTESEENKEKSITASFGVYLRIVG